MIICYQKIEKLAQSGHSVLENRNRHHVGNNAYRNFNDIINKNYETKCPILQADSPLM